jgi:hypothetical protein
MANPLKGQILVKLGGKDHTCRLNVDAIISIETELDKGILSITQKLSEADVRMGELVCILLHAIRGGGNDVSEKDIKNLIQDAGIVDTCSAVASLLVSTMSDPSSEGAESKKGTVTS